MNCSFAPDGSWFVFCEETGKTIRKGFKTKQRAIGFIALQLWGAPK